MNKEEIMGALFTRRSIRKYSDEPVSDDAITAILEAGRWAPSGLNNQPWRFLVVRAGDARQEALAARSKYAHVFRAAKVLVCVFLKREEMYNARKDYQGAGACVQNMLLAAHAHSLGAVWLGEIINHEPEVVSDLGLDPEVYEMMAVVAVGHPAQKGASSRKPLSELMIEEL